MSTSRAASFPPSSAIEVRRDGDGELCGYVVERADTWEALTVFGAGLGEHPTAADAERQVRTEGLASLAERWTLVDAESGDEQIVCIQEASPAGVRLALDYYSLPGVPTLELVPEDLAGPRWRLARG
jgi:hypothetical protein